MNAGIPRAVPAALLVWSVATASSAGAQEHAHPEGEGSDERSGWRMPPIQMRMPVIPGLEGAVPDDEAFLPGADVDPASVPEATFRKVVSLRDGDTLALAAGLVRRTIKSVTHVMYGFNGQYPGPVIHVPEEATILVDFRNEIDLPTTVHWHGVRLKNAFDGVPEVTQAAVEPGGRFQYEVHFEDPGIYWYHPHVREDIQQDLGLYGNMLVEPAGEGYYSPVNRQELLMLDDLLIDAQGLYPWGRNVATHAVMGRFGNVLLVNGEDRYELSVRRGEVVRFFLTNVSNTRTFNLSFGDARVKVVAADLGKFEREAWVESVPIGPAQRYVVEALFDEPGDAYLTNRIQAIDHFMGEFYPHVDTLGIVRVAPRAPEEDHRASFERLREQEDVAAELEPFREHFDRPPDHELLLTLRAHGLHSSITQAMFVDTLYAPPLELNDAMPMMNWLATSDDLTWVLRDTDSGRENMEIEWSFSTGDVVKLRLFNDPRSLHPMNHPMHLHGQRFLLLERDGVRNQNLAWKDTVIVPVGSTVDILVEMSNPGRWMLHCHVAEHLAAGMMMTVDVEGESGLH